MTGVTCSRVVALPTNGNRDLLSVADHRKEGKAQGQLNDNLLKIIRTLF